MQHQAHDREIERPKRQEAAAGLCAHHRVKWATRPFFVPRLLPFVLVVNVDNATESDTKHRSQRTTTKRTESNKKQIVTRQHQENDFTMRGGSKDCKRALDAAKTHAHFNQQPTTTQPGLLVSEAEGEEMARNLKKVLDHKKAIEKREATAKAVIKQALNEIEKQRAQTTQHHHESRSTTPLQVATPSSSRPPSPTMSSATSKTHSSHSWTIGQFCHSSLLETSNLELLAAARRALQTQIDKLAGSDHEIAVSMTDTFLAQAAKVDAKMVSLRSAFQPSTSTSVVVQDPVTTATAADEPATSITTPSDHPAPSTASSAVHPSHFPVDDRGLPAIALEDMHINQLCNPKLANYPDLAMLAQIITYLESQLNIAHIGFALFNSMLMDAEVDEDKTEAERDADKAEYTAQKIKFNQAIDMLSKSLVRLFAKREELEQLDTQIMEDAEKEKDMSETEIQMAIKLKKAEKELAAAKVEIERLKAAANVSNPEKKGTIEQWEEAKARLQAMFTPERYNELRRQSRIAAVRTGDLTLEDRAKIEMRKKREAEARGEKYVEEMEETTFANKEENDEWERSTVEEWKREPGCYAHNFGRK